MIVCVESHGTAQPPRNSVVISPAITTTSMNSDMKNRPKRMPEYSRK